MESEELALHLVNAHTAGFGVLRGFSSTFEDLRSTGNLALIKDAELRSNIVTYYESWQFNADRVEARRSHFPGTVYALLPPEAYRSDIYFDAPSSSVAIQIDREALAGYLLGATGMKEARAELNYARFFAGVVEDLLMQSKSLLNELD